MGTAASFAALLHVFVTAATDAVDARSQARKPHVAIILADDYGWNNVGWHGNPEVQPLTPTLDELAKGGVILDRHCTLQPQPTTTFSTMH